MIASEGIIGRAASEGYGAKDYSEQLSTCLD